MTSDRDRTDAVLDEYSRIRSTRFVPHHLARHELATLIRDTFAGGFETYGGYGGPEMAGDVEEWYPEAEAILARFEVVERAGDAS